MKRLTLLSLYFLFVLVNLPEAFAYKFVIFTDEAVNNKSDDVIKTFKNTYPFNTYNIEFEVVRLPSKSLDCDYNSKAGDVKVERLVTCNNIDDIQKMAKSRGGEQAMVIKNLPRYGGSSGIGGGVPVITTDTSPRVMLHEYLHTLGLCDEYKYQKAEAKTYCKNKKQMPNAVYIKPRPSYSSDMQARDFHEKEIPWYNDILMTTMITSGPSLGTGSVDESSPSPTNNTDIPMTLGEPTGLYRGKACDEYEDEKIITWHPGAGPTIMDKASAGLGGPLETIVDRLLKTKGMRKKMSATTEVDEAPQVKPQRNTASTAGEVIVQPETSQNVNNSGRSLFKSFFSWVRSIFESIGRAFSR